MNSEQVLSAISIDSLPKIKYLLNVLNRFGLTKIRTEMHNFRVTDFSFFRKMGLDTLYNVHFTINKTCL